MNRNLVLLFTAQAVGFAAIPMIILLASIIAAPIAPSQKWATLPLAMMVIGTALSTVPTAKLMAVFGRRAVLIGASFAAIAALYLLSHAVVANSFWLLCIGVALVGFACAAFQHFRFIAMESVAPDKASMATSVVLLGGIIAAFIGPELGVMGRNLTDAPYQGSFFLAMIGFLGVALISCFLQLSPPPANADDRPTHSKLQHSPALWRAVLAGAIGYGVMSFIMTATPLSMHHHYNLSLDATKLTIQAHIVAMFLPSLFTPLLIKQLGINKVILLGCMLFLAAIIIGISWQSHAAFITALVILGVGWNFLFVAGTAALPDAYQDNDTYRVQGFNDFFVFSFQAAASLSAGWLLSILGWQWLLGAASIMLVAPALAVFIYKRSNI